MIYAFNQDRWPESIFDERLFQCTMVDGDGNRYDCSNPDDKMSYTMWVDTTTGQCLHALRSPDGGLLFDHNKGEVKTGSFTLTPPILLYSKQGELINPQDETPNTPTVVTS